MLAPPLMLIVQDTESLVLPVGQVHQGFGILDRCCRLPRSCAGTTQNQDTAGQDLSSN